MGEQAKESSFGPGLHAWAEKLKDDYPDLAQQFFRPRQEGSLAVEAMGLPKYKREIASADAFLHDSDAVLSALETERYFVFLQPKEGKPSRRLCVTKEETIAFVQKTIPEGEQQDWQVMISEFKEPVYGGNIHVDKAGVAHADLRVGNQGPISAGTATPDYRAWQDPLTSLWKYSFDDPTVRQLIQQTVA